MIVSMVLSSYESRYPPLYMLVIKFACAFVRNMNLIKDFQTSIQIHTLLHQYYSSSIYNRSVTSIVRVVSVVGCNSGGNVGGSSVSGPSGVSEVILAVVSPSGGEGESSEVDRLDDTVSGESDSLHALHGETVVEFTDVNAVDRDL